MLWRIVLAIAVVGALTGLLLFSQTRTRVAASFRIRRGG